MGQTPTIPTDGHADSSAHAPRSNSDRRMLIDEKLLETERTFASLNPATGEVLGPALNATVEDAQAVAAEPSILGRACDSTSPSSSPWLSPVLKVTVPQLSSSRPSTSRGRNPLCVNMSRRRLPAGLP